MESYDTVVPTAEIYAQLGDLWSKFAEGDAARSKFHELASARAEKAVKVATTAVLNDLHEFWLPEIGAAQAKEQFIVSNYDRKETRNTDRYRQVLQEHLGPKFVVSKVKSGTRRPHTTVCW